MSLNFGSWFGIFFVLARSMLFSFSVLLSPGLLLLTLPRTRLGNQLLGYQIVAEVNSPGASPAHNHVAFKPHDLPH